MLQVIATSPLCQLAGLVVSSPMELLWNFGGIIFFYEHINLLSSGNQIWRLAHVQLGLMASGERFPRQTIDFQAKLFG